MRFVAEFARRWPRFPERLAVRGGITGLAQVEGLRGDTHVGERLEVDLRYMAEWSLARDVRLLLRTVPAVVARRPRKKPQMAQIKRMNTDLICEDP